MSLPSRPTKADLAAAHNAVTVPDILAHGLGVLFVGINPGLYSGATGHHFARPGNRFWPALHRAGFTPRQLHPSESYLLPSMGLGLTKVVQRATATAAELTPDEVRLGGARVRRQVRRYAPRAVCFLGIGTYNDAYARKGTAVGRQPESFEGAILFVLPNPSGLNANYQLPDFVRLFTEVREALGMPALTESHAAGAPAPPAPRTRRAAPTPRPGGSTS